jgi:hypothetical protein
MDGCEGGNVFDSFADVLCQRLRGMDEASEAMKRRKNILSLVGSCKIFSKS